jgi:hypothetical protein
VHREAEGVVPKALVRNRTPPSPDPAAAVPAVLAAVCLAVPVAVDLQVPLAVRASAVAHRPAGRPPTVVVAHRQAPEARGRAGLAAELRRRPVVHGRWAEAPHPRCPVAPAGPAPEAEEAPDRARAAEARRAAVGKRAAPSHPGAESLPGNRPAAVRSPLERRRVPEVRASLEAVSRRAGNHRVGSHRPGSHRPGSHPVAESRPGEVRRRVLVDPAAGPGAGNRARRAARSASFRFPRARCTKRGYSQVTALFPWLY